MLEPSALVSLSSMHSTPPCSIKVIASAGLTLGAFRCHPTAQVPRAVACRTARVHTRTQTRHISLRELVSTPLDDEFCLRQSQVQSHWLDLVSHLRLPSGASEAGGSPPYPSVKLSSSLLASLAFGHPFGRSVAPQLALHPTPTRCRSRQRRIRSRRCVGRESRKPCRCGNRVGLVGHLL